MLCEKMGKRKVLVADDEESNRTVMTFILKQEGWEVSEACNGKEALDKVLKEQPDLLILDNRMPILTGIQVYQQLQLHGIKIAVVLVSGNNNLKKAASSVGIVHFIHKPFDFTDFLQKVNSAYEYLIRDD
ncbi:response regulator receiver domain protein [Nostoc carneum NIES-2107]|nr:response regulator receiver domain protein [Nostoc carneum NIES-2107]